MIRFLIVLNFILIIVLSSCNTGSQQNTSFDDRKIEQVENGFSAKITHSAGDLYAEDDLFLPLPFNIAKRSGHEIIVLSPRIQEGKSVKVNLVGMAKYIEFGKHKNIVIAIPTDIDSPYKAQSFASFAAIHSSTLWMIEHYLVSRRGKLGSTVFDKWLDENKTKTYLISETKTTKN